MPNFVPTPHADDPRLAPFMSVRERDLGRRDGLFIVEGRVTLGRLVDASRFPVEAVLLAESRLAPLASVVSRLAPEVAVYVAPQSVMDAVAGFHVHRGVLALARRIAADDAGALLAAAGPEALILGLVGLSNHDNVGACFRNAAAFGADAVLLDAGSCDPLYRKAIRVSAGTVLSTPFARGGSGGDMIDALSRAGFETWALSPGGAAALPDLAPPARLAIILGAEGPGLPPDLLARTRSVRLPIREGVDSLNVATAGALALAHARWSRRPASQG
ncbi:RNA methyltransferase [bacterium]|nr:RNA methyltransferase [bacterium]